MDIGVFDELSQVLGLFLVSVDFLHLELSMLDEVLDGRLFLVFLLTLH